MGKHDVLAGKTLSSSYQSRTYWNNMAHRYGDKKTIHLVVEYAIILRSNGDQVIFDAGDGTRSILCFLAESRSQITIFESIDETAI